MTTPDTVTLHFHLPTRQHNDQVEFAMDRKKLQQWMQELPRANTGETARQFYLLLKHLNHAQLPDQHRLRILETVLQPCVTAQEGLKTLYAGEPFPLSPRKQSYAQLSRQIAVELLTGYRIIADDRVAGAASGIDRHQFHLVLHRCMELFGIVLLRGYLIYSDDPPGIWREIHGLYRYAEHTKLHLGELADTGSSIEEQYIRILLLEIASPHRQRQSDLEKIYQNLLTWSATAHLRPVGPRDHVVGHFTVDLDSGSPPEFRKRDPELKHPAPHTLRIVDTREMIVHISKTARVSNSHKVQISAKHRYMLAHDVLKQLLVIWNGQARRHFSRTPVHQHLQMAVGMTACHTLLTEEEKKTNRANRESSGPGQAAPDVGAVVSDRARFHTERIDAGKVDVWNPVYTIYSDSQDYTLDTADNNIAGWGPGSPMRGLPYYEIVTGDVSAYGLRFSIKQDSEDTDAMHLKVGEICLTRNSADEREPPWTICVVRWIRNNQGADLEVGLQKLSPLGIPVGIRKTSHGKEVGDYHRALLLPEIRALQQRESIIFPAILDTKSPMRLFINGKTVGISLRSRIESTADFHHYEFEYSHSGKDRLPEDDILRGKLPNLRKPGTAA